MAFKKGKFSKPQYSISTSIFVRKGKYIKGPSFGLWIAESGPMARGSVKEDYLMELASFLKKAASNEQSVSFALFKNKLKKSRDEEDEDDDEEEEEEEDEDEDADEDEDEEEEKPSKGKDKKSSKSSGKSAKKAGKKGGKKSDWDFDDDDED